MAGLFLLLRKARGSRCPSREGIHFRAEKNKFFSKKTPEGLSFESLCFYCFSTGMTAPP